MSETTRIKKALTERKPPRKEVLRNKDLLSTGSTMLNLALTDKARGGFYAGKYYFVVGDSNSGKSFITLTCFAEASINPNFENHRLIHDNAEDGALMDMERFFGPKVNERIEPPAGTREEPIYSSTIEEFYFHVDDALDDGRPFIYVLDSMDALESDDDRKKFRERKNASRKQKETSGSYGLSKAKINSSNMRSVIARLKKTGSILIVISQTRDAIGFTSVFNEKTRAGGRALRFYAHGEFWTSVVGTIKKKMKHGGKDKTYKLGIKVRAKVEKNRVTGRQVEVDFPIYWSFGLDDLGGCVDWLVSVGHWKVKKGVIDAEGLGLQLPREPLIDAIQDADQENQLKSVVQSVWDRIKSECSPQRKRRYG